MSDFIWPSDMDRAESDELNRVCECLEAVWDERDELAAQNAKLKAALVDFSETVDMLDEHTHPNIECDAVACAMREAANASPAVSLSSIKAQAIWEFKARFMHGIESEAQYSGLEVLGELERKVSQSIKEAE